ncbi:hypothetical protein IV203_023611 [Nitzschia inconspicua]|uniref:Uncharacterized protein n=1 Tax=Nitzschia inconspicua TaxID=303405 RepID=A0A9K3KEN7_9STRA|nr:hypothetical protein IV203_023611 [Nitzschia inconspicua]
METVAVDFKQESWWEDLHNIIFNNLDEGGEVGPITVEKPLERFGRFHQDCIVQFYDETLPGKDFFQACCLFWTEHLLHGSLCVEPSSGPVSPKELFEALKTAYMNIQQQSTTSIIQWILPPPVVMSMLYDQVDATSEDDYFLSLMSKFWTQLFDACNSVNDTAAASDENQRPTKRRRMNFQNGDGVSSSRSNGKHNLPAAILLLSIMKQKCETWGQLIQQSRNLSEAFPTFTSNTIQSALALVGLNCICQEEEVGGLSIVGLFDTYFISDLSFIGLSILQTLQQTTGLDLYHLRAVLCRQLFDTVFARDSTSEEQKDTALTACTACMRNDNPMSYLDGLSNTAKITRMSASVLSAIPSEVVSTAFPVLTHLKLWLLTSKAEEASILIRRMDSCSDLDEEVKEQARLSLWQYLFEEGELFLDGNNELYGYEKRQAFLYEKVIAGISDGGFETMIAFYQTVAQNAFLDNDATFEEKQYVVRASQQTVLRLFIQAHGLGDETVLSFIKKTEWPVELSSQVGTRNLSHWCAMFLQETTAVPQTLIREETFEISVNGFQAKRDTPIKIEVRRFLDLSGHFFILRSTMPEKAIDKTVQEDDSAKNMFDIGNEVQYRNSLPRNIMAQADIQDETKIDGVQENEDTFDAHEEPTSEGGEENVFIYGDDEQIEEITEEGQDRHEEVHEHQEIEILESDDDGSNQNETSEEDLPLPHQPCAEEESDEDDQQFYGEDEDDAGSFDEGSDVEENSEDDNKQEDDRSSEKENDSRRSLQGGQNEDDAIELDDSDSDSGHDEDSGGESYDREECGVQASPPSEFEETDVEDEEEDNSLKAFDGEDEQNNVFPATHKQAIVAANQVNKSHVSTAKDLQKEKAEDEVRECLLEQQLDNRGQDEPETSSSIALIQESFRKSNPDTLSQHHKELVFRSVPDKNFEDSLQEMRSTAEGDKNSQKMESDATDDEKEITFHVEKAETEDAIVGGEFGDTTDEEEEDDDDDDENRRTNRAAETNRRADVLQEGYNSQLGDGYEPEDTHGYTEEDGSEAIHTEDEEDEHGQSMNIGVLEDVPQNVLRLSEFEQNIPHSSDDMDMADEHTEQEDPGAESSELEDAVIEGTPTARPSVPPISTARPKDATTLVEFAQTAQHHHDWKPKTKEENINNQDNIGLRSSDKDATFDADDEKDGTEGSKNLETEEESLLHGDPQKDTEGNLEVPSEAENPWDETGRSDYEVKTFIDTLSDDRAPQNEASVDYSIAEFDVGENDNAMGKYNKEKTITNSEEVKEYQQEADMDIEGTAKVVDAKKYVSGAAIKQEDQEKPGDMDDLEPVAEGTEVESPLSNGEVSMEIVDQRPVLGSQETQEQYRGKGPDIDDPSNTSMDHEEEDEDQQPILDIMDGSKSTANVAIEALHEDPKAEVEKGGDGTKGDELKATDGGTEMATEAPYDDPPEANIDVDEPKATGGGVEEAIDALHGPQEDPRSDGEDKQETEMDAEETEKIVDPVVSIKEDEPENAEKYVSSVATHTTGQAEPGNMVDLKPLTTATHDESLESNDVLAMDIVDQSAVLVSQGNKGKEPGDEDRANAGIDLEKEDEDYQPTLGNMDGTKTTANDGVSVATIEALHDDQTAEAKNSRGNTDGDISGATDGRAEVAIDAPNNRHDDPRAGGDEGGREKQLRQVPIPWKKGDIVVSCNPKYLRQEESARIVQVNEDEDGNVTYDLRFLTSRDRAKNVDPSNILPLNDQGFEDGDDISSVGMEDEASRQTETTPAHGTPHRTRRRKGAIADSPRIPQKIDTRSMDEKQEESILEDVTSVSSTPSRSRRVARSATSSSGALRRELSPIAETPGGARGASAPRLKAAKSQASISASSSRRSIRSRKRNKKFDDDSNVDADQNEDDNDKSGKVEDGHQPAMKTSDAKRKKTATKNAAVADSVPPLTRRSTRSRVKKDDEESVASETPSVARTTRSRTKKSNDDDQSVLSRMSTRSTRSSTRQGKK